MIDRGEQITEGVGTVLGVAVWLGLGWLVARQLGLLAFINLL
jgi:hypothetical protein